MSVDASDAHQHDHGEVVDDGAVVRELRVGESHLAIPALRELRPHLGSDDEVVDRLDRVQRAQGYRLFAVVVDGERHAVAVAGFRMIANLAWGDQVLYVDDLVTAARWRGRGHATRLLHAIDDEADRLGAAAVHLDSGVGPDRADAHRRYLSHGYRISSHHFQRDR